MSATLNEAGEIQRLLLWLSWRRCWNAGSLRSSMNLLLGRSSFHP